MLDNTPQGPKSIPELILGNVLRPIIRGIHFGDERLTRVAMKLMGLRVGSAGSVHPKNVVHANASEKVWFEDFLPSEGGRVLDLGAGSGSISIIAAKRGARVTAIERNPVNIKLLKSMREKAGAESTIDLLEHDLEATPYPIENGAYDAVISHDVIEHLYNRRAHLIEAARALKPKGRLILSGPNRLTTWKRIRGFCGLPMVSDLDHKIEYSRDELLNEASSAGFTRILYETTSVIDFPIGGLIDLVAPVSLDAYRIGIRAKQWLGQTFPGEITGFWLVFEKTEE